MTVRRLFLYDIYVNVNIKNETFYNLTSQGSITLWRLFHVLNIHCWRYWTQGMPTYSVQQHPVLQLVNRVASRMWSISLYLIKDIRSWCSVLTAILTVNIHIIWFNIVEWIEVKHNRYNIGGRRYTTLWIVTS